MLLKHFTSFSIRFTREHRRFAPIIGAPQPGCKLPEFAGFTPEPRSMSQRGSHAYLIPAAAITVHILSSSQRYKIIAHIFLAGLSQPVQKLAAKKRPNNKRKKKLALSDGAIVNYSSR